MIERKDIYYQVTAKWQPGDTVWMARPRGTGFCLTGPHKIKQVQFACWSKGLNREGGVNLSTMVVYMIDDDKDPFDGKDFYKSPREFEQHLREVNDAKPGTPLKPTLSEPERTTSRPT